MSLDLQKLRHDRRGRTFEPMRQRPDIVNRWFSVARYHGVDSSRNVESPTERLEAQEQKVSGKRAPRKDVQGKGFPDTDATAGVRSGSYVL